MKHLITMTACLLLLVALLSQFVQNQQLFIQLEMGGHAVDLFCETRDEPKLKHSLGRIMDCEESEITVKEEGDFFVITAPVECILATPEFWGVDAEANQGIYRWEREVKDG